MDQKMAVKLLSNCDEQFGLDEVQYIDVKEPEVNLPYKPAQNMEKYK